MRIRAVPKPRRHRDGLDAGALGQVPDRHLSTRDFADILNVPTIDTMSEVMGGSHPTYEYTTVALRAGKRIVTANKALVAAKGRFSGFVYYCWATGLSVFILNIVL